MKDLVILLSTVAVITAAVIYISKQPGGYIETKGGSECSWRTAGDATTGYRDHMFNCRCKRSGREYNCTYRGDPDSNCPKFYKKIIDYFLEVVSAVAGKFGFETLSSHFSK
jgi:hypothetical protein